MDEVEGSDQFCSRLRSMLNEQFNYSTGEWTSGLYSRFLQAD